MWLKPIQIAEVEAILEKECPEPTALLARVNTPEQTVNMMARAIRYSAAFEAGVLRLAGACKVKEVQFDVSHAAFTTLENPWPSIAKKIMAAARDEEGKLDENGEHLSHRQLAEKTLSEMIKFFFGNRGDKRYMQRTDHDGTNLAIRRVLMGYTADSTITDVGLHTAIGFHLGAETLSARDFQTIVKFLNEKYPALMAHLKDEGADEWLMAHLELEPTHASLALEAANELMATEKNRPQLARRREDILYGVREFAKVEAAFAKSII